MVNVAGGFGMRAGEGWGRTRGVEFGFADRAFANAFIVAVVMRIGLGGSLLNLLVPYHGTGGFVLFKIHPGSYLLMLLGAIAAPHVLRASPMRKNILAYGAFAMLGAAPAMVVWAIMWGRTTGIGYLVDNVFATPFALVALAYLHPDDRIRACKAVVNLLLLNSLIVLVEFASRTRLTPYPFLEATFRPAGLFGHPLSTGTLHTALIPAIFLLPYSRPVRWLFTFVLAASVFASQARFATVLCGATVGLMFMMQTANDMRERIRSSAYVGLVTTISLMFLPLGLIVLLELGFFDRIMSGFDDESTQARFIAYDLFNYMSTEQFLFGMDYERAMYYLKHGLKIEFNESVIVHYVINFGVFAGAYLFATIVFYFLALIWKAPIQAKLVAVLFLGLIMASNGLASKISGIVFVTLFTFGASSRSPRSIATKDTIWRPQKA